MHSYRVFSTIDEHFHSFRSNLQMNGSKRIDIKHLQHSPVDSPVQSIYYPIDKRPIAFYRTFYAFWPREYIQYRAHNFSSFIVRTFVFWAILQNGIRFVICVIYDPVCCNFLPFFHPHSLLSEQIIFECVMCSQVGRRKKQKKASKHIMWNRHLFTVLKAPTKRIMSNTIYRFN